MEEANKAFQYAVDAFERIGDKRLWEENATLLSMVLMPQGKIDQSARLREQLYQVGVERSSTSTQGWSLLGQAEIAILRCEFDAAINWLEKAGPLAEEIGVGEKIWYQGLRARVYWRQGRRKLAEQAAERTAALTAKAMPVNFYALEGYSSQAEVHLGMLELANGSQLARKPAQQSIKAMDKFARVFPLGKSRALIWKGLYYWLTGRNGRAHTLWRDALSVAQQQGLPYEQALAHYEMGRHLIIDDPARRQHLEEALEIFNGLGAVYDQTEVRVALDQSS